jgi:hypothetical protein
MREVINRDLELAFYSEFDIVSSLLPIHYE